MPAPPARPADPLPWCGALAAIFGALVLWRLGTPSKIYFDEVHYVPAARALLALQPANLEHPLLAKEAIAASIRLLGDTPFAWRLPSALMGTLGLFAFGRALWWASGRPFAALAGMVLLASDFAWFIQSRIAMLDMVMAGLTMVALWMLASAMALPGRRPPAARRLRLAAAGVAFGLAMGAKWSVMPVWGLVAIGLPAARIIAGAPRRWADPSLPPCPGLPLAELALWLMSVPLAVYWLTYLPGAFFATNPVDMLNPVGWHRLMFTLQESVVKSHPYQTVWYEWVGDWRGVWYLYEVVDGAQRGIMLIGNPFTMLAGLAGLGWCLWAGVARRQVAALAAVWLYAASLGLWVVAAKPVQFYYHYLLPGSFLMAALALALDALWAQWRPAALVVLAGALGVFAWFFPIIAALPLQQGTMSFEHWMWLPSWR